jgi:hypothetical protein
MDSHLSWSAAPHTYVYGFPPILKCCTSEMDSIYYYCKCRTTEMDSIYSEVLQYRNGLHLLWSVAIQKWTPSILKCYTTVMDSHLFWSVAPQKWILQSPLDQLLSPL